MLELVLGKVVVFVDGLCFLFSFGCVVVVGSVGCGWFGCRC